MLTYNFRDSMAALALASDPPTEEILNRKPAKRTAPLISIIMWKMIIGQAIFQLIVTFVLYYVGPSWLNIPSDGVEIRSLVFNTFVWMQVWNMLNNRRLDNKFNILQGAFRNYFFMAVFAIMVGCQVMIMYVGGRAFSISRISGRDWGISLGVSAIGLPFAVLIRLFPDAWFEAGAKFFGKPFVMVYRPLARWTNSAGRKIKGLRRKREESEKVEEAAEVEIRVQEAEERTDIEKGRA